ncbi:MAG: hypothetical protein E7056_03455 [Lentisphaerae bacterium]|nr:hypothetical protein [Lentisphaerota bacterium]
MINIHKFFKYSLALIVTLVLVFGISMTQRRLDSMIRQHDLFFTGQINNAPPVVTFTTMALGSFRGLIADLLWLRAASLQEDKNYFEMVQLASWITKLQPRFASATAYLAWNMAYNISVTCSLWQDRWYWVWEGIKLIRDEALVYNPDAPRLYWELAVIFQQKMGNVLDNASYYYKARLATEMEAVITAEPKWELWSTMPMDEAAFMKLYPKDDPMWKAANRCGIADYKALNEIFRQESMLPQKFVTALNDLKLAENLDAALRTIWLYDKYRLRAEYINTLNKEYGSMDWRLAEAQAIYWASEGIRVTGHDMQCSRIIATCLQEMVRAGRVLWTQQEGYRYLILAPNLDMVMAAIRTYDWAREEADNLESFRTGKINFMKNASVLLFIFGRFDETKEVYELLKKEDNTVKYPPFKTFLDRELKEIVATATFKQITDIINAFIQNALTASVNDKEEEAATYELMAKKIYADYQSGISSDKERGRRGLAPYNEIRNQVVKDYLEHADPRAAAIIRAKIKSQRAGREEDSRKEDK